MKLVILYAAAVLALTLYAWITAGKNAEDPKAKILIYVRFLVATVIGAIGVRHFQAVDPGNKILTAVLKICASLPSVLLALKGYLREKNSFDLKLVIALILCMLADAAISISFIAGGAGFAIAHIVFVMAFIKEEHPTRKQLLVWIVLIGVIALFLLTQKQKLNTAMLYIMALTYLSIMITTVVFSRHLPRIIFLAAIIFAISDCLLIVNIIVTPSFLSRLLALLVYYCALQL